MQQYSEEQFRNKVIYISFVLALLVIVAHTYNVDVYGLTEKSDLISRVTFCIEKYVGTLNNIICIPFFYIISGYLFFRTFRFDKLKVKYTSRLRSLVIPYIVWSSFYYIFFVLCTNVPSVRDFISHSVVTFSLQEWYKWIFVKEYYTLWFLKALILYVLMAPVNYLVLKNWWKCSGLLALVLIIGLHLTGHTGVLSRVYSVYYLIGAYIGINHKSVPMVRDRRIALPCGLFCIFSFVYVGWLAANEEKMPAVLVMLFCFALWGASGIWSFDKDPKWWMRITFFTYCFHDVWLEGFEKILLLIFGKRSLAALADYIFMPLIVFAVCAFWAGLMQKLTPKLWKILSGGRA